MSDETKNLSDLEIYEMEDVRVNEFHPLPDGQGDPTQVHLTLKPKGSSDKLLLVLRLKSRDMATQLIDALVKHTNNVWPIPNADFAKVGTGKSEPQKELGTTWHCKRCGSLLLIAPPGQVDRTEICAKCGCRWHITFNDTGSNMKHLLLNSRLDEIELELGMMAELVKTEKELP